LSNNTQVKYSRTIHYFFGFGSISPLTDFCFNSGNNGERLRLYTDSTVEIKLHMIQILTHLWIIKLIFLLEI